MSDAAHIRSLLERAARFPPRADVGDSVQVIVAHAQTLSDAELVARFDDGVVRFLETLIREQERREESN